MTLLWTALAALLALQAQPDAAENTPSGGARVTLAFAGDVLPHLPLVESAWDAGAGVYDFRPQLEAIAPYIASPDYAVANLETCLAGAQHGYSDYPRFNCPASLADALKAAGIDMLTTANNHALDYGWAGLSATLQALDDAGLDHAGTYRDQQEQQPHIIEVKGIRLALLTYAEGTNVRPAPLAGACGVNLIDAATISGDAARARALGADLIIASLHFGWEYRRSPSDPQRALAEELAAAGVDVIIGSHPHVVQPVKLLDANRDDPAAGPVLVAYSLGNFISNQRRRYRDSGIILYLTILKTCEGTRVEQVSYLPVYVRASSGDGRERFQVLPVHPDIVLAPDPPLTEKERRRMNQVWEELLELLGGESGIAPLEIDSVIRQAATHGVPAGQPTPQAL